MATERQATADSAVIDAGSATVVLQIAVDLAFSAVATVAPNTTGFGQFISVTP